MSDALVRLDYLPSAVRRRKRTIRKSGIVAMVLFSLWLGVWWWGGPIWKHVRLLVSQHRQMTFIDPPGKVVYVEDPVESSKLLAGGGYQRIPYAGTFAGTDWDPVVRMTPGSELAIFLHGVADPVGRERLLYVKYSNVNEEELGHGRVARLSWVIVKPAGILPGSRQAILNNLNMSQYDLAQGLNAGDRVRFFGGQPDPNDPSRFTIRYEINDAEGLIEGKLTASDQIELKQR